MADNGVQPHIVEAVLNHVSGHKAGVAGIYNRATYAVEIEVRAPALNAHHVVMEVLPRYLQDPESLLSLHVSTTAPTNETMVPLATPPESATSAAPIVPGNTGNTPCCSRDAASRTRWGTSAVARRRLAR